MLFKKKCPICGAKNSKERMFCTECGAPLASEQVKKQLSYVSTEAEAQVKTVIEKEPRESVVEMDLEYLKHWQKTFNPNDFDAEHQLCTHLVALGIQAEILGSHRHHLRKVDVEMVPGRLSSLQLQLAVRK